MTYTRNGNNLLLEVSRSCKFEIPQMREEDSMRKKIVFVIGKDGKEKKLIDLLLHGTESERKKEEKGERKKRKK